MRPAMCWAYLVVRKQAFAYGAVVVQESAGERGIAEDFGSQENCTRGLGMWK